MTLKETLRNFISKNTVIFDGNTEFTDDDNYFEMGFVNSIFGMNLVAFLEEHLSITIDNDDLDLSNFNTINNIVAFLKRKQVI